MLTAIRAGKVEKGTYLVIESFDRISRADIMTQFEVFIGILQAGINIVSLTDYGENEEPKIHWGKGHAKEEKAADAQMINIIITLSIFVRALDESMVKSKRGVEKWDEKRKKILLDGEAMTGLCPFWLKVKDKKFVELDKQVEVVHKIFKLYEEGKGYVAIASQLIKEGIPYYVRKTGTGKKWTKTSVVSVLNNKAVYGVFENEQEGDKKIIKVNYYPPLMDRDEYMRVIGSRSKLSAIGGETGKLLNVFRGVAKCECGRKLVFKTSQGFKDGKAPVSYLQCSDCKKSVGRMDASLLLIKESLGEQFLAYRKGDDHELAKRISANNLLKGEIKELDKKNCLSTLKTNNFERGLESI